MEDILKAVFVEYGPLGLGWPLFFMLFRSKTRDDASLKDLIQKNTQALTEFKVLLTERLPRGGD